MTRPNRRQFLQAALAGGAGLTLLGRFPLEGMAAQHPLLGPETRPDPAKPEGVDLLPGIEHVVVVMMENHSYDSYFGTLSRGDGYTLGPGGLPTDANPDAANQPVTAYRFGSTDQTTISVHQSWLSSHRQYHGGVLDQFVIESDKEAMAYWTAEDIPFYQDLAETFPVCDRFFCSVLGPTYPNRRFLTAATAHGLISTDIAAILASSAPTNGVIFERFDAHGISWANYSDLLPEVALWPTYYVGHQDTVRPTADFYAAAATGTLPFFSLVTPHTDVDEHPPKDLALGEQFAAGVIKAVLDSPAWSKTVLVLTYDEHGGFYDHVVPPPAAVPDAVPPSLIDPNVPGTDAYDRYGFRVPSVIVSPFAKANYVSHVTHDFTSILRLMETKWNLGALTARDANASNLLDALDLTGPPPFATPPAIAAPLRGYPAVSPPPSSSTSTSTPGPSGSGSTSSTHPLARAAVARSGTARAVSASPRFTG